ncbi:MAG TPA: response regulator transcription factor [Saprospiraceae bacterium]|jgi:DNA-binding NarL/FixJ family response regulator|nr:response regulator transcription factor [Saprospiraceae bacterium]HQW25281.1 response regulator transcription factor [Saprospiraceae bacterium]
MSISLVIYEDNVRLRESMELLLGVDSGFSISGAFSNCAQVIKQMETLAPQLVIMDIDMPGMSGIEGVRLIKSSFPDIKVIMYTVFDDDNRIFECICNGADGYLLKNTSPLKLIQALQELAEGGAPMSPFVAKKVFQFFRNKEKAQDSFNLTPREIEILEWLVRGNSYKMIADKSFISIDTVKKHLQNIYHKLHVNCGTEAVVKALQHKIVRLD